MIQKQIKTLTNNLIKYNLFYHNLNTSLITDEEYDKLYNQLKDLESKYPEYKQSNSPTNFIGFKPLDCFTKNTHNVPMLSLNNIFSHYDKEIKFDQYKELYDFLSRSDLQEETFIGTTKYDGLAMSIIYVDGVLEKATTRGDGYVGEDVTENVKTISNVPNFISKDIKYLEVRGEVMMRTSDFERINDELELANQKTFSNPRNAASGTIRQLDSRMVASRPLFFVAYSLIQCDDRIFNTHMEKLTLLSDLGFNVGEPTILKTAESIIEYYASILNKRFDLEYGIDGVVYILDDIKKQQSIGYVSRAPKFAIAHKFPPEETPAKILNIEIQVGRTGALTPVAKITPTKVGGVIVSSITLHNQDEIIRKDIRIGDTVMICRAGDVIPKISKVVLEERTDDVTEFSIPSKCPVCGSHVAKDLDEAIYRCQGGLSCDAQVIRALTHFVAKNAMNIDGLGNSIVELLYNKKLISNVADIYNLEISDILCLEGFKSKSANKLLTAIEKSKTTTLNRLIYSLGIRNVGENTSKNLAKHYKNLDNLLNTNLDELLSITDIGEISANSILEFINDEKNKIIINKLIESGINYEEIKSIDNNSNKFNGLSFVITGTLSQPRDHFKEIIESNGGKVSGSVSKKTNYLLAGDEAGSKLTKATDLGITILNENDFNSML